MAKETEVSAVPWALWLRKDYKKQICIFSHLRNLHFVMCSVRQKAKELVEFVQDDDRVRDERRKAKKTKDKYVGMAGEAVNRQYSM